MKSFLINFYGFWIIPKAAFHFSALASFPKAATDRNAIWIAKSESKAGDKIGIKTTFYLITHRVRIQIFIKIQNIFAFKICIFSNKSHEIFLQKICARKNFRVAHEKWAYGVILPWSESFMRHPIKSCVNFSSFLSSDVSDYYFRIFFGPDSCPAFPVCFL